MKNNIKCLNNPSNPYKRVLFLGYDVSQTRIIKELILKNCYLDHTAKNIYNVGKYDLVICYGYKHILSKDLIKKSKCFILNLHISYLPYNKGAHPNFWAFYDKTPFGVTIHLIDEGIDTGPIIFQKNVTFNKNEVTFEETYKRLKQEIEILFIENISNILLKKWTAFPQKGCGTKHYVRDLPKNFSGWKSNVYDEIKKLKHAEINDNK